MTTIGQLTVCPSGESIRPDVDPLVEQDAFQEAQLLAVRFDVAAGQALLLFELRLAIHLVDANTGVLALGGVRRLDWTGPSRAGSRTAWTVGGSCVGRGDGLFEMSFGMWPSPGAQFELAAESATFYAGDVPELPASPPDYVEDDQSAISRNLAAWDSSFVIKTVAHLNARSTP